MKELTIKNEGLLKRMDYTAAIVSAVVLALVVFMRSFKIDVPADLSILPLFHAILNGSAALFLIAALVAIKNRNIQRHKTFILIAMSLSVVFLLSYVVYHITSEPTLYCKEGTIRYIYFFFLLTHVVLAAGSLPFILFTFNRAWTDNFTRHKKMAKWVFPIWLYVAITGPLCYFMLQPCY